jgi:hypothetical protein
MNTWTADIMTDPARGHKLQVELREAGRCRAWLYQDDEGQLQLRLYDGPTVVLPVQWLLGIIARFKGDLGLGEKH